MATREAACHCGQLRLEVDGDPFAVSICNCLACQRRRTGSAFGMQAGFKADQVRVVGRFDDYARISDEPVVFIGIALIGFIGLALNMTLSVAESRIVHWKGR